MPNAAPIEGGVPGLNIRCPDVGQQGDLTRPLDRQGQFALVLGAGSGNPPRDDFTALRGEIAECLGLLVFDYQTLVGTKAADFASVKNTAFTFFGVA